MEELVSGKRGREIFCNDIRTKITKKKMIEKFLFFKKIQKKNEAVATGFRYNFRAKNIKDKFSRIYFFFFAGEDRVLIENGARNISLLLPYSFCFTPSKRTEKVPPPKRVCGGFTSVFPIIAI